jgi:hypothetical protein
MRNTARQHDAAVAVAVAERAGGEHQARQRDRVAVHDPLQGADRRAEALAQARDRDVDHGHVELDQEQPSAHGDERRPAPHALPRLPRDRPAPGER